MTDTIDTYTHKAPSGRAYEVQIVLDEGMGYPWDECDGHGSIRTTRSAREKRPGEVVIDFNQNAVWLYDYADAVKTARADGWGSEHCTPDMTPGQRAAQAVRDDMDYCRRWLEGDLFYVGLLVSPVNEDGDRLGGDSDALWGVEYGYGKADQDYARATALDMIEGLDRAAAREAEERDHWAARDVLTA